MSSPFRRPWFNLQHSCVMTFLHINIYEWSPSLSLVQLLTSMWWPFCTKTFMSGPLHHPWFNLQYSCVMTFLHLIIYEWWQMWEIWLWQQFDLTTVNLFWNVSWISFHIELYFYMIKNSQIFLQKYISNQVCGITDVRNI